MIRFWKLIIFFHITVHCYSISDEPSQINIHAKTLHSDQKSKIQRVEDEWKLRYFPGKIFDSQAHSMFFESGKTDIVPPECDDTKTNTTLDWDGSPDAYTCAQDIFPTNHDIMPIIHSDFIPPVYQAPQVCMKIEINYTRVMSTFGAYRPIAGQFGEYKFIPRQRWLHNSAAGAVIGLYHPCANKEQIERLRNIITSCLRQHIITPFNLLPSNRPLALVTWGWHLSMNTVDFKVVTQFIKEHALRGPKTNKFKDGIYNQYLIKSASTVSDEKDSLICPNVKYQ